MDVTKIGDFIKERRKALRLTQGHVAEHLGVTAQAVSKWERGENLPDVGLFPDLSKILQVGIEEILRGGVASPPDDLEGFASLTPSQKTQLIAKILPLDGYALTLDEILPYSGIPHKNAVLDHILARRDFDLLEQITSYLDNGMKARALAALLADGRYDIVEDIMPAFNRKHRDAIVEHFTKNPSEDIEDILENFIPFFDKNQIHKLRSGANCEPEQEE